MRRALLLMMMLSGCGPHDVDLIGFDGGRPPMMMACAVNSECAPDQVCDKHYCDDPYGVCMPRMGMCRPFGAVCGCDNVTYANDCARRQAGVSGSTAGACQ